MILEVKCYFPEDSDLSSKDRHLSPSPGLRALGGEMVGPERVGALNYYKFVVRGHRVLHVFCMFNDKEFIPYGFK